MNILKRNTDGSFTVPAEITGGVSANGIAYQKTAILDHLKESSLFMKRLRHGGIKSELGRPERKSGENPDRYWQRCWAIEESNVCCTILHVHRERIRQHDDLGVILTVKPSGPKGPILMEMIAAGVPMKFAMRVYASGKDGDSGKLTSLVTLDVISDYIPATARVA